MQHLDTLLTQSAIAGCKACFQVDVLASTIQIQQTRKEFEGHRTIVVFPLTRVSKKSPEETGKQLGEWLMEHEPLVVGFQIVKGFLNLSISSVFWSEQLVSALNVSEYGIAPLNSLPRVMVEYSSPNTNKPLHLGHLRNNFLGFSVAKILRAAGHEVIKVQIINDRGIHICKSMVAWKRYGNGETPESSGIKGDKLVGKYYVAFDVEYKKEIAVLISEGTPEDDAKKSAPILLEAQNLLHQWERGDAEVVELWKKMNAWVYAGFEGTYSEMGVSFDKLYYESDTYLLGKAQVEKGLKNGVFFQKEDGSTWIDLSDEGLDEKLVLRKDGTSVYMTQDIGTALMRYEEFPRPGPTDLHRWE